MARLPASDIDRLKTEVSLQRLVEAKGIALKKHGANDLIGTCPFHDDKTPSLVVSPGKNLWNCLGACQTGGTVIDWVMKTEGVSFRHAAELLKNDTGLGQPDTQQAAKGKIPKRSTRSKLPSTIEITEDDYELTEQVADFYQEALKGSPEAKDYLSQRGLTHPDLIEHFRIGFSNRTFGYRMPPKTNKEGKRIRERLAEIGLYRKSGHEHFNGSIVVPITDPCGNIVEMYGRKITAKLKKGLAHHLYLPGPHRGVFNWNGLGERGDVILCESIIDAMTFWCHGLKNVTASYGTSGFTKDHLEVFKAAKVKRVLIAYDRDEAGNNAATRLAERLADEGFEVFRLHFPKGMDANEYAQTMKPAAKALDMVIRKATWMAGGPAEAQNQLETIENVPLEAEISPETAPEPVKVEAPAPQPAPPAQVEEPPLPTEPPPSLVARLEAEQAAPSPPPGADVAKAPKLDIEKKDHEILLRFGNRRVRVRGLEKNKSYDALKVSLQVTVGELDFIDKVDLYSARQMVTFIKMASTELEIDAAILKRDIAKTRRGLEGLQEEALNKASEPKDLEIVLSEAEKEEALDLLKSPNLLDIILEDFNQLGIVGEANNKLAGYLACTSRKLDRPLAVIVQSSSAAGKSSLMDAILNLVPKEERIKYSAMTGQSLYYLGETNLKHKILAVVEEEGAERASYALKLLQSEGELTIASTGKDPQSGELVTKDYHVEGPVMLFLTTTASDIDEELLNRCLVLTVDEGIEQTEAIHRIQREGETLEGYFGRERGQDLIRKHQNAQRLIERMPVINPYARQLTFSSQRTRTRRDHMKYLTLIRAIALLHQHQRPRKTGTKDGKKCEYIEVSPMDIEIANRLSKELLGRSLDELPPQTRNVLNGLLEMVEEACTTQNIARTEHRFTRRGAREYLGCSNTQARMHLERLIDLEYVLVHRGQRGIGYVYELLFRKEAEKGAFLANLNSPEIQKPPKSASTTTGTWRGVAGPWRGDDCQANPVDLLKNHQPGGVGAENAYRERNIGSNVVLIDESGAKAV